jgi:hypothetical protein
LPDLLSSVTPPLYRLGVLWTLHILLSSGMSFPAFLHWFNEMKYDASDIRSMPGITGIISLRIDT